MNSFTFLGIALLIITFWDYQKDKLSATYLFDSLIRVDVSRSSTPLLFWLILVAQTIGGIFLVLYGIRNG